MISISVYTFQSSRYLVTYGALLLQWTTCDAHCSPDLYAVACAPRNLYETSVMVSGQEI